MKFPTAAAAAACRGGCLRGAEESVSVCTKPSVSAVMARQGAAPSSWGCHHRFFVSLVSRWRASTAGLKWKTRRDMGKPLPDIHSTRHWGPPVPVPRRGVDGVTNPTPSASAPRTLRKGPHQGARCDVPSHYPTNKGALAGGWYLRILCDPFSLLRWPLWKGSNHQPQQPLLFPIFTHQGVGPALASNRDLQPGSNCGGEGELGLDWWEDASLSPWPLLHPSWVLGSSAGGAEHFPYPDFAV